MEREVIREDITSGEAGGTWTRLFVDGPWRDFRRACCLVGLGICGGFSISGLGCILFGALDFA